MGRGSGAATRSRILDAASAKFAAAPFAEVTVREIAAAASADPALVIRYFGSKELLFLEAMHLRFDDVRFAATPESELGVRLVAAMLEADEATRGVYLALVRGSDRDRTRRRLTANHEEHFVAPLRAMLSGPDAEARARVAGSVLAGLLFSLWVVEDPGLLAMDRERLVERYGRLVQAALGS